MWEGLNEIKIILFFCTHYTVLWKNVKILLYTTHILCDMMVKIKKQEINFMKNEQIHKK